VRQRACAFYLCWAKTGTSTFIWREKKCFSSIIHYCGNKLRLAVEGIDYILNDGCCNNLNNLYQADHHTLTRSFGSALYGGPLNSKLVVTFQVILNDFRDTCRFCLNKNYWSTHWRLEVALNRFRNVLLMLQLLEQSPQAEFFYESAKRVAVPLN